jgi:DNA-binding NtrC family response regulator
MDTSKHILGKSKHAEALRKRFHRIAGHRNPCVIVGESGVGKSFLAAELGREDRAFHAIPTDRVTEDELDARLGECGEGTVLFDDVDAASFRTQQRIAHYLADHPRGVRIIVTLAAKADELHRRNRLVDELYGKVLECETVEIQPLRERPEDIPAFVRHFAPDMVLDINGLEMLIRRHWQGNLSELRSVIERCLTASGDGVFRLPAELVDEKPEIVRVVSDMLNQQQPKLNSSLDGLERGLIERALALCGFDMSKSAKFLGMEAKDFEDMVKRHGLSTARNT